MSKRSKLRELIAAPEILVMPGVFDGYSTRLLGASGFAAGFVTGAGVSEASLGWADQGIMGLEENLRVTRALASCCEQPLIADADTGYGNALNAQAAARAFERAGVAAFHLEDQTFPKKCGHYNDKGLVPAAEMVQKLKAVRDALHDADFVVIARTDAIAVEGFAAAIDRAFAYHEAGADMLFVEAPTTENEIAEIGKRLPGFKLINMFEGGKTPLLPAARLQALGFHVEIIPSDAQRAAIKAMQRVLATIARDGSSAAMRSDMVSFAEREVLIGTAGYVERSHRYAS